MEPFHRKHAALVEHIARIYYSAVEGGERVHTCLSEEAAAGVSLPACSSSSNALTVRSVAPCCDSITLAARSPSAARSSWFSSRCSTVGVSESGVTTPQRVGLAEDLDDVAKVFGMRPYQDGRPEQRCFQHIVTAARDQAAADERQIGELVQAGQLAD